MKKRIPAVSTFLVSVALLFGNASASEHSFLTSSRQTVRSNRNTRRRKATEELTEVEADIRETFSHALLQRRKSTLEKKLAVKTETVEAQEFFQELVVMSMGGDPGDDTETSPKDDDETAPVDATPTEAPEGTIPPTTLKNPNVTLAPTIEPTVPPTIVALNPTVAPTITSNSGSQAPLPTAVDQSMPPTELADPDVDRTLAPTQLGINTPPPTSGAERAYSIGGTLLLAILWAW